MPPTTEDQDAPSGIVVADFYADGTAFGLQVRITGTLQGQMSKTVPNGLYNRQMCGNWNEEGGKSGVFCGVGVNLPSYSPDADVSDSRPAYETPTDIPGPFISSPSLNQSQQTQIQATP